ncbi:MAG: extracellular solute-binding protein [Clostridiales bacterium]|nr:extracellular solute-binding protein [Clostridiales bacterium]
MKRTLALVLALLMLCMSTMALAAETEDRYGRYDETVTVSILSRDFKTGTTAYDSSDPTRKSASENAWIMAYKEYLNLDVKRIIAEDDTALQAQVSTALASNDLPDAMIVDKATFYNLVENEVLADLLPAYNGYEQKYYLEQAASPALESGMVDGQLLGLPIIGNSYNNGQLLWVRQDWLKKVNMEAPKTIDEMMAVAQAFIDAKLGGEETIGIAMNFGNYYGPDFIAAAYGSIWKTWTPDEEGVYRYGKVTEGNKQALLKMQEIYKAGLVRPDFASSNLAAEDVAVGRAGMYMATSWHSVTDLKTSMLNDETAEWMCYPAPTLDGEPVKQWSNGPVPGSFLVVSSECEHPEAFLKMIELELKVFIEPSAEELPKLYADPDDDFIYWDLRTFRNMNLANFDLYRSQLVNEHLALGTAVEDVPACITDYYGQVTRAIAGERALEGRRICQVYAFPLCAKQLEAGLYVFSYDGPLTENMSLYEATLESELNNAMIKVIMGEDISVYEKAVDAWYANGGQDITDEVTEYYASK